MPVLVGVGVSVQQNDDARDGEEALELMARAARRAAADAGAPGLLGAVGEIAVPKGTWSYRDPGRVLADRVGARHATTVVAEVGVPQHTLVARALDGIAAGRIEAALVVGGEAKARARAYERCGAAPPELSDEGAPDVRLAPAGELVAQSEVRAGIWAPVEQYALIDSAIRYAEGRTSDEHRDEISELWAGFNRVAQSNPHAAFAEPRTATWLRDPGPDNRPMAFPYNKWHCAQWAVDQSAALLLCSAEAARHHHVDRDRWVFPMVALESSHSLSLSRRRDVHRWPAMNVLGIAAAEHLGLRLADIEHIELYSCFPSAVRVQQRELGLPIDAASTLTGGMSFAGGPFNNFTYQATAAMADRLRAEPGTLGLVTTVSGLLTKPSLMVWGTDPPARPLLIGDLAARAEAATPSVELADAGSAGPAVVVAVTTTYEGGAPARVVVVGERADGGRVVNVIADPDLAAQVTSEELIGSRLDLGNTA